MKIKHVTGVSVSPSDNPQAVFMHLQNKDEPEPETFVIHTMDVPHLAAALLHSAQSNANKLPSETVVKKLERNLFLMRDWPLEAVDLNLIDGGKYFLLNLGFTTLIFAAGDAIREKLAAINQ